MHIEIDELLCQLICITFYTCQVITEQMDNYIN